MNIIDKAFLISNDITGWRRDLHRFPEIGMHLPKTEAYVKAKLDEMGISYQTYEKHSGIVALIGKKEGKCVALRADMDALPIQEETGLEISSTNENMHACGHDAHTAMLLGAAKILKDYEEDLEGQVKLLFQPAEEGPGGAYPMIKDGVLENPKVDYILAMHTGNLSGGIHNNGDLIVSYGHTTAADDQVFIKIIGKGAHGSTPDVSVDPISIAALAINNIQYIISREISPFNAAVISFGSLEAGRGTYNVIPETAILKGTIRTLDMNVREFVFKRIREILEGLTSGMRAEFELEFLDGYPPVVCDPKVVDSVVQSAKKIMPEEEIKILERPLLGGEDAGFFFQEVPGSYFFFYNLTSIDEDGNIYSLHHPKFDLDDSILYKGSAIFAQASIDILKK